MLQVGFLLASIVLFCVHIVLWISWQRPKLTLDLVPTWILVVEWIKHTLSSCLCACRPLVVFSGTYLIGFRILTFRATIMLQHRCAASPTRHFLQCFLQTFHDAFLVISCKAASWAPQHPNDSSFVYRKVVCGSLLATWSSLFAAAASAATLTFFVTVNSLSYCASIVLSIRRFSHHFFRIVRCRLSGVLGIRVNFIIHAFLIEFRILNEIIVAFAKWYLSVTATAITVGSAASLGLYDYLFVACQVVLDVLCV